MYTKKKFFYQFLDLSFPFSYFFHWLPINCCMFYIVCRLHRLSFYLINVKTERTRHVLPLYWSGFLQLRLFIYLFNSLSLGWQIAKLSMLGAGWFIKSRMSGTTGELLEEYKYLLFSLFLLILFIKRKVRINQRTKKMLNDLIAKPHKTESKKLLWFRRSVIIIFLLTLILFFTALVMKLVDEKPSMSSTFEKIDNLPVPGKNGFFLS